MKLYIDLVINTNIDFIYKLKNIFECILNETNVIKDIKELNV